MPGVATLLDSDIVENYSNGIAEYQYTETYQVFATNTSEGPVTILSAPGLPAPKSAKLVPSTSTYVWCLNRHPKRQDTAAARLRWIVTCTFTNLTSRFERDQQGNPVDDPLEIVPRVDFNFQESYTPITWSVLRALKDKNGVQVTTMPQGLPLGNKAKCVYNSAGDKIEREKRESFKTIIVRKTVRDWDNAWEDALDSVNDADVTISQSDSDGVRMTKTYPARELLFSNLMKMDVWRQGKLYFDVGFVLEHKKGGWRHIEPDAGTRRWLQVDQYKPGGGQYSSGDFVGGLKDKSYQEIPTYNDEGEQVGIVGDPVQLNGYGMELGVANPDTVDTSRQSYSLEFDVLEEADFSALGIT